MGKCAFVLKSSKGDVVHHYKDMTDIALFSGYTEVIATTSVRSGGSTCNISSSSSSSISCCCCDNKIIIIIIIITLHDVFVRTFAALTFLLRN